MAAVSGAYKGEHLAAKDRSKRKSDVPLNSVLLHPYTQNQLTSPKMKLTVLIPFLTAAAVRALSGKASTTVRAPSSTPLSITSSH